MDLYAHIYTYSTDQKDLDLDNRIVDVEIEEIQKDPNTDDGEERTDIIFISVVEDDIHHLAVV